MLTRDQARALLHERDQRATAPRIAVIVLLSAQEQALSHTEVLEALGDTDWDPATIYRNLIKLTEVGITRVVSRASGMARYALALKPNAHDHPHFVCTDCGAVSCLPDDAVPSPRAQGQGRWGSSLAGASIQLQGSCPDCIESH